MDIPNPIITIIMIILYFIYKSLSRHTTAIYNNKQQRENLDPIPFGSFLSSFIARRLFSPSESERILCKLQGLIRTIAWSPEDISVLFDALLERFELVYKHDRTHLLTQLLEMLHCIEVNYITPTWSSKSRRTLLELVKDTEVTNEALKVCLADDEDKTLDEIIVEIRNGELNQVNDELLAEVRDIVSSVEAALRSTSPGSQLTGLKKDLLSLCQAAEQTHFRPRLTQMVSWCLMALSETGRLIQVGTGEGKSCIVAMFAAFRAMRGEKVDIMSSSSVLAETDMKEWKDFYDVLKISVDCNINKQDKDSKKCYESQVVYGTVEEFSGEWLKHHVLRMDIFGQRTFQCAIVDEVDSLMLDKGHHVLYLSSDMPALQHLNPLLALIWATANQYSKLGMYPDKNSVLRAAEEEIRHFLHFTPCELNKIEGSCYIPGFLSDLVESKLKVWIENAFLAQTMETDQEYVLESHGIVPVDYSSTGIVQNFMTWSDGLQQFLQMKHQSKLSNMTTISNYMSNVGLLQKYKTQIYGLSGTLGKQAEIETMSKIYEGIKTCQIPSFKRRKLFEVQGVIMKDEKEWIKKIWDVVTEQTKSTTYREGRAVLVICETIKQAKMIYSAFGRNVPNKMFYINNNMDNDEISNTLKSGDVIIATNLAGRGTDLKISDSVKKAGGLFVVQTFLPKNARVEAQAFGRAGRQGSPGSGQLIVYLNYSNPSLSEKCKLDIMIAKKIRDDLAAEELRAYTEFQIPKIKKEEKLFSVYLEKLELLYERANNNPLETDLSALNEFWGIWLLTKVSEKDSIETLTKLLQGDLDKALENLRQGQTPLPNLHHYTVYGKYLQKEGKLLASVKMYTRAVNQDHCWAAVAYYNRAFASLIQQNSKQRPGCLSQALADLQNALKSVELYCEQLQVTYSYVTQQTPDSNRKVDSRFDKQRRATVRVLASFKANITEALQKVDRAMRRGGHVKVEEKLIFFLGSPKDCLPSPAELMEATIYSRNPLKSYQIISQPSFDTFNELESLHQIGLSHIYALDTLFSLGGFISMITSRFLEM